jgi:hypothetical protein
MSLSTTIEQLKKTLHRADRTYAEARARHPALAPYASPSAVLNAVDRGSRLSLRERDVVLLAVLDERQRSPHPLWQSLLVVAFAPMLVRLRKGLRHPGCENLDQRVLVAFVETIASFPHRLYIQRNLRLATGARLIAERRREHRATDTVLFDDETYVHDVFGADAHLKAAAAEVIRIVEAAGGEELRDALIARHAGDRSLKDYIDTEHPELTRRQRERICDRLRRTEGSVLRKVRARLKRREWRVTSAA